MRKPKQEPKKTSGKLPQKKKPSSTDPVKTGRFYLENSFLKVTVNEKGWITVEDKAQQQVYENLHVFEVMDDSVIHDRSYVLSKKIAFRLIESLRISLVEEGPLKGAIRIRIRMKIAVEKREDPGQKYPRKRNVKIWTTVRLKTSSKHVEFETRVASQPISKSVNILFPSGCQTTLTSHDSEFSLQKQDWKTSDKQSSETQSFVQLMDEKRGLALLCKNPFTFDLRLDNKRTLAFHLIHSGEKFISPKTVEYAITFHCSLNKDDSQRFVNLPMISD